MTMKTSKVRDLLEAAAEARRVGDLAAADAAEMAAVIYLRTVLAPPPARRAA